ncbi:hypothetical protein TanjilG_27267 [Lupinus angustifolius]|uniref:Uncharacterized protein n=1 Tax=Lupinus angustifolius TaxID=3871 RepID=A0A1J7FPL1_LUPAN|nr:hypothetical protein TanjilG_27267 [Lupinus angustifolius]
MPLLPTPHPSQRDAPRLQARTRAHDTLPDDWTCAPSCCGYAPEGFTKHHILPCRTGRTRSLGTSVGCRYYRLRTVGPIQRLNSQRISEGQAYRVTLLLASQTTAPRLQARERAHDTLPDDWTCAPSCCGYAPEGFTKHHILPCRTGQNQKPRNARHYPTRHRVTKPEPRQPAPGHVRPGFGMEDDSVELPTTPWKNAPACLGQVAGALGGSPMACHPDPPRPQKDGGPATLEASARPTDARNYPTRHRVTKPAPRQEGLTHQEIRVGPRGTVEALDASPTSPTCPDDTKPKHQPAPGRVRPGFGMEDGSVELPTTPWKNAPACLGQLAGALGGSPMACHPDPPRNAWNIIPKHFPKLRPRNIEASPSNDFPPKCGTRPVLSRLFDARGRGPEGPVPNPSPDRHAATRSRRESSSSSPPTADGFGTGTPVPSPQSQSFSRGYGSILPTSLAYIVPSTRGCSPWRPDAVMSTTGRGRHSVLRIFKGRRGRTGHHATCGALPAAGPYLRLSRFQGGQAICTDDRSARAHAPGFAATAAPSYSSGPGPCPDGRVSAQLGTVTQLPVHPASPVLLTKNGPLGALDSVAWLNKAATPSYLFKSFAPIPKSDERFARQYRCGPPPEFPLASPRSGIVHHLSGPDRYALTRTLHRRSGSVGGATHKGIPPISFLAPYGFTCPLTRTHVRLLGPCFKTGRMGSPQADARSTQVPKHTKRRALPTTIAMMTSPRACQQPGLGPPSQFASVHAPSRLADRLSPFHIRPRHIAGPHPLPSRQFQALFDSLFKVLFIFPSRYLFAIGLSPVFSLGRNLPPDWGCIPKQPDSPTAPRGATGSGHDGALTLSGAPFQGTWARSAAEDASPDYNSDTEGDRFSWRPTDPHGSKSRKAGGGDTHDRSRALAQPPSITAPSTADSVFNQPRALGLMASGATCVQRLDGSRDSAIHTKYRISLRSSSMQEPRYPLPRVFRISVSQRRPHEHRLRADGGELNDFNFLGAFRAGVLLLGQEDTAEGSPTETLLRLLLPLNDKVQWTSHNVAGSEPPTSPQSEHFTGPFNRQIAPPTKNGHAPPPIESRKSSQSVNPYYVWTCGVLKATSADPWSASFMVETRTLFVFHKSKNFTSDYEIRMPPTVPVNHYSDPEGQHNRIRILCAGGTTRPVKARSASPAEGTSRPVHTNGGPIDPTQAVSQAPSPESNPNSPSPVTTMCCHRKRLSKTDTTAKCYSREPINRRDSTGQTHQPAFAACTASKGTLDTCDNASHHNSQLTLHTHHFRILQRPQEGAWMERPTTHFRMIALEPLRTSPSTTSFRAGPVTVEASERPWDAATTDSAPWDQSSASTANTFPRDKPNRGTLLLASQRDAPRLQARTRAHDTLPDDWTCAPSCCGYAPEGFTKHHILPCRTGRTRSLGTSVGCRYYRLRTVGPIQRLNSQRISEGQAYRVTLLLASQTTAPRLQARERAHDTLPDDWTCAPSCCGYAPEGFTKHHILPCRTGQNQKPRNARHYPTRHRVTKPEPRQPAPGHVRPGFGMEDDSVELPTTPWKNAPACLGQVAGALGGSPMACHPDPPRPQKDGGPATLEASARPTDARNYPTRHRVTKPAPRQEGLTHQEIRVGPRGTVEALDASPTSPTCPDDTKPKHQPAPGRVRPGFGMEDGSVELPTTPWKNAPACLGQLAGALGGSPMACHPDPPRNAWNIIPKHFPKLRPRNIEASPSNDFPPKCGTRPVLSRLFDARGRGPEGPVPNPSPDRHAATRSRRESSSSSPPTADGFGTGTPVPSPQSQSFSRGYGSILPTSLAYIVPSTRGCSPWRPDAVMSTTGRGRHSVLRIFKGRRGRTGHHATCGALPAAGPYLRLSRFQGGQAICTDDRSARAHAPGFAATAAPSYSSGPGPCPDGRVSAQLGTVTQLPVHPASPVLLTKNGPLGALDSVAWLNKAATPSYLFKSFAPIPKSDERFARQYRCGPPPEFPLASPRSGIVHHLSGPDRYALTRTLHRRSGSVGGATHKGIPPISFLAPYGFTCPLTRTHVRLLGPCFKTGRMGSPQADARSTQVPKHTKRRALPTTIAMMTSPRACQQPGLGPPSQFASVHAPSRLADRLSPFHIRPRHIAGPHPLPSRQFQALFDSLFKVLFIFPSRYLFAIGLSPVFSLGRNLPPDWGCIPKQPDSPTAPRGATGSGHDGALTLSGAPFQGTWARSAAEDASPDYNSDTEGDRFSWRPTDPHGSKSRKAGGGDTHDRSRALAQPPSITAPSTADSVFNQPRALGLMASGATCVQRLDGSRDSAIHTKYRIWLRSSSMQEPRYPLPRVFRISVSQRRPHEHSLRADGGELNDFNFLCAFHAGVLLLGQKDTAEGSPTETLLRLLLPLNDKVQRTFHNVAGSEPPIASTANTFPRDKPNRGTLLLASQRDAPRLQARTRAHDTLPDDWTCAPSCCGYAPEGFTKHHILPCRTGRTRSLGTSVGCRYYRLRTVGPIQRLNSQRISEGQAYRVTLLLASQTTAPRLQARERAHDTLPDDWTCAPSCCGYAPEGFTKHHILPCRTGQNQKPRNARHYPTRHRVTKPEPRQPAPGHVRPGFGMEDDSVELPTTPWKNAPACLGQVAGALGGSPMACHPDPPRPQKDGGPATLEASARPTDARNYPTRHRVTKPAPRQEGLTHQEIRVGPRGTVEALDASPTSPTCPDDTKPKHQPAPGRVRPGFGMEDGSVELPTTPWKNAPACLGQLAGALGGSPMACHPDPPRNAWNIIPKHFPKLRPRNIEASPSNDFPPKCGTRPVLSRLFDARGRGPEGPVPNPSPDRHAATRSRRESSSSSPPTADGFGTGTPVPSPQSQSFSRGYGSILPTSLAYIVPSTRGCSPWRPDAVMSTTGRGRHSVLRIFKGRRGRTGHHATCGALPAAGPYLRLSRFQGGQAICTDDRSARAHAPGFAATAAPSYSSGPGPCPDGRVSAQLGTVTQLPVHPASPVLLTKNGPLGALDSVAWLNKAATPSYLFKSFAPIPKSDERFARQYRCGPPPEFPLASPRSGIVHHLSGPDRYALTRTLHRRSGSVGGATHKGIPPISFLAPYGFTCPLTRTHVRLLGPCFKTGRMGSPQADARSTQVPKHTKRRALPTTIAMMTSPRACQQPGLGPPSQFASVHAPSRLADRLSPFHIRPRHIAGPHPLPSRQFQALFDSLFKVLFIFPSRYLFAIGLSPVFSLGRNLPPDWGCIPKQPDSPTAPRGATGSGHDGALTLSGAPFQGTWARSAAEDASPDYNSDTEGDRFSWWAFPVRVQGTGQRCATPKQACPQPNGFGHNLRSKTRRFTGFSNSHQYHILLLSSSMQEPRYPLPRFIRISVSQCRPHDHRLRADRGELNDFNFLARSAPRQIAPPTKNGHAPPPIESRKSSQSVNPYYVWTCAGGTTRPVKARSASPTEGMSRPVHTNGGPIDPTQAVSQAPSPESNPNSPSPVTTMVGHYPTIES